MNEAPRIVYLSGGVGGARLLDGLARIVPAASLTAIVNVGDDFEHWGLRICPDLDTVMYTLAGLADAERGWGLAGETYEALAMVRRYSGAGWFALGDRDLATHLMRSERLRRGERLTEVTAALARALGVHIPLLPASDQPHPTRIETETQGTLTFQDWLVRERGAPPPRAVRSGGRAEASAEVHAALAAADLVVIGPSNPYVSIDPILDLPGVRAPLRSTRVVAVSPLVGGRAVKGPLAAMIPALTGEPASAAAIARHYDPLLDGFVLERGDTFSTPAVPQHATATVMRAPEDRVRLAREVLAFATELA